MGVRKKVLKPKFNLASVRLDWVNKKHEVSGNPRYSVLYLALNDPSHNYMNVVPNL